MRSYGERSIVVNFVISENYLYITSYFSYLINLQYCTDNQYNKVLKCRSDKFQVFYKVLLIKN